MRGGDGRVLHDKGVGEVEEVGCLLKGGFRSRIENQACQGPASQGDKCSTPSTVFSVSHSVITRCEAQWTLLSWPREYYISSLLTLSRVLQYVILVQDTI